MQEEITLLFGILGLYILYVVCSFLFRRGGGKRYLIEGMESSGGGSASSGIAGNAAAYAATVKSASIQANDVLLISKYRSDYETAILAMDDLVNAKMLQIVLSVDPAKPDESMVKLGQMQQAKVALNSVMKYVDKGT